MRDQVFISYSHRDSEWLAKLQTALKPLVRDETIAVWADTRIQVGERWRDEIARALARAKVAVLLVSHDFLASDFIAKHELPPILNAAAAEGLTIAWIPLSASNYEETELADYQAAYDPNSPLDSLSPANLNKALVSIAKSIKASFTREVSDKDLPAIAGRVAPCATYQAMLTELRGLLDSGALRESELGAYVLKALEQESGAALAKPFDLRVVEQAVHVADAYFPKVSSSAGTRDWQREFPKVATPILVAVARSLERSVEAHAMVVRLCERVAHRLRLAIIWPNDPDASNDVKNLLYSRCLAARELEDDDVLVTLQSLIVVGPS